MKNSSGFDAGQASGDLSRVLKAARRTIQSSSASGAKRVDIVSLRDKSSQEDGPSLTNPSVAGSRPAQFSANRDHRFGMTARNLLFSDRQVMLRPFINSSNFVCMTVLWLLLPVLIMFTYLVASASILVVDQGKMVSISYRMAAAQLSESFSNSLGMQLVRLPSFSNATLWTNEANEMELAFESLARANSLFVHGGSASSEELGQDIQLGSLSIAPSNQYERLMFEIFASNACLAAEYPVVDANGLGAEIARTNQSAAMAVCEAASEGLIAEGFLASSFSLASQCADAVRRIRLSQVSSQSANNTFLFAALPDLASDILRAAALHHPYMRHAALVTGALVTQRMLDRLESVLQVISIVSWSFIGVFVGVVAIFYTPSVWTLGLPLRSARNLLTLIPQELVNTLPDLHALIRDLATEAQLVTRTGGVMTHKHAAKRHA